MLSAILSTTVFVSQMVITSAIFFGVMEMTGISSAIRGDNTPSDIPTNENKGVSRFIKEKKDNVVYIKRRNKA